MADDMKGYHEVVDGVFYNPDKDQTIYQDENGISLESGAPELSAEDQRLLESDTGLGVDVLGSNDKAYDENPVHNTPHNSHRRRKDW